MDGIKSKAKFMNEFSKIQPRVKSQSEPDSDGATTVVGGIVVIHADVTAAVDPVVLLSLFSADLSQGRLHLSHFVPN